jgi:hypothetical protein
MCPIAITSRNALVRDTKCHTPGPITSVLDGWSKDVYVTGYSWGNKWKTGRKN